VPQGIRSTRQVQKSGDGTPGVVTVGAKTGRRNTYVATDLFKKEPSVAEKRVSQWSFASGRGLITAVGRGKGSSLKMGIP